jgi:hypothetical protein
MIRGVESVATSVTDVNDHMNREQIRAEYQRKLWNMFYPKINKDKGE